MKNRHIMTMTAVLLAVTAVAQTSHSHILSEKLNAFVESKEYGMHRISFSQDGLNAYQFAQQFAIEGEAGDNYYGPLFTPRMWDQEKAFGSEVVNAKTVYFHDASEGDSPLPGVKFQLMTDSRQPMIHSVSFNLNKNVRLISFEEPNGHLYALLLMWNQTVDPDKNIGDMFLMDGMIYEVSGWKMDDRPFIVRYKKSVLHNLSSTRCGVRQSGFQFWRARMAERSRATSATLASVDA